jgi:DNA invertase Pin-like site-specific DNA recombinase
VSKQLVISRAIELGLSKQTKRWFIDTEKLKTLVEQGLSWIKIGKALGVSDYTAHRRASELGFIKKYTKRKKSDADQLKSLVEQGLNWTEIGKILGVSHVSARERANRLGIFKQDNRRKTSE